MSPINEFIMNQVLDEIATERDRQDAKWGDQSGNTALKWQGIALEELGEVARAELDKQPEQWRKEWIEVAAVAVAAVEYYDRGLRFE